MEKLKPLRHILHQHTIHRILGPVTCVIRCKKKSAQILTFLQLAFVLLFLSLISPLIGKNIVRSYVKLMPSMQTITHTKENKNTGLSTIRQKRQSRGSIIFANHWLGTKRAINYRKQNPTL